MYGDLEVPQISDKRHSEPFPQSLQVPTQIPCHLSAPDLSFSPHQLFRQFCSLTSPSDDLDLPLSPPPIQTSKSSPARSVCSSASVSPKRSPPSDPIKSNNKRASVSQSAGTDRRNSRARRTDDEFDNWEEFNKRRAPHSAQCSQQRFLELPTTNGYRCRSFSITPKGSILNLGDVLVSDGRDRRKSTGSCNSVESTQLLTFRVVVIGYPSVGKSSLIEQFRDGFTNSSTNHGYKEVVTSPPASNQCSLDQQSTRILLDGDEFDVEFDELLTTEVNSDTTSKADAFIVVYSVADRKSLVAAEDSLKYLSMMFSSKGRRPSTAASPTSVIVPPQRLANRAFILAANKADLARARCISSEEGRALAKRFECRFLETSACIGHNVDELLVETLKQIRHKQRSGSLPCWYSTLSPTRLVSSSFTTEPSPADPGGTGSFPSSSSQDTSSISLRNSVARSLCFKARGFFQKIWFKCESVRTKSCDDLHVLWDDAQV